MTKAALCLALLLSGGPALAQNETAAAARAPAADKWIYTETVSPLDYSQVVIASASAGDRPDGPALQLSIQCRRGHTELVLASAALAGRPEEPRVAYTIDDGAPLTLPVAPAAAGNGLQIRDDAVRWLRGLPAEGEITFTVSTPAAPLQGRYALKPLKAVLNRMAGPCKWPSPPR